MKKTKKMTNSVVLTAAIAVLSCSQEARGEFRDERRTPAYKAAMADYSAGRLEEATAAFEKVLRGDGENASARFQLACLLQDYRRDYLGAVCQYREYLRLEPGSDKAPLAKERMELCEVELAKVLAEKHGIMGTKELSEECERAKAAASASAAACAKAEKAKADALAKANSLSEENARLRRMLSRFSDTAAAEDTASAPHKMDKPDISDVIADEANAASPENFPTSEEELGLGPESDDQPVGRSLAEAKAIAEEVAEDDDDVPTLLDPAAPPAPQKLTEFAASRTAGPDEERPDDRPETYVVQDGDTLYKIALRFYGKTSAWKDIRDANKAIISTDGRIQSGQTIKLP